MDVKEGHVFLEIRDMRVGYGAVEVLKGISLQIEKGKVVCLLGANGAGKSTALRALSGLVPLTSGEILFDGQRIDGLQPHHIVRKGVIHVPEERRLFPEMGVQENLEMGAYLQKDHRKLKESLEEVLTIFPRLKQKLKQQAGTLSGGEQQMAAIGRALMSRPRLLVMDEPTLGLSPLLCETVMESLVQIKQRGTSLLLSEQNSELALEVSDEGYIMRLGEIVLHGTSQQLATDDGVTQGLPRHVREKDGLHLASLFVAPRSVSLRRTCSTPAAPTACAPRYPSKFSPSHRLSQATTTLSRHLSNQLESSFLTRSPWRG